MNKLRAIARQGPHFPGRRLYRVGACAELGAANPGRSVATLTTATVADHLSSELPSVDVLVRTSGEQRVSNFLLWQSAGAAMYFTDTA